MIEIDADMLSNGVAHSQTNFTKEGAAMTSREAIKVLMLSPFYFKLDLVTRKSLIKEFCSLNSLLKHDSN
nr:hypothetical protein [Desulfobulbaceae bacterium]